MNTDRRTHKRAPINMEVALSSDQMSEHPMWLRNLSASGAYVQIGDVPAPLPTLGSKVQLIISAESGGELVVEKHWARVMRAHGEGVGLMFLSAIDGSGEEGAEHREIA